MNSKWHINEENLITILADETCTAPELYIKLRGNDNIYTKIDKAFIARGSGEFDITHTFDSLGKYFIKITNLGELDDIIHPIDVVAIKVSSTDDINLDDVQIVIDKLEELKTLINNPWEGVPEGETLKYREILLEIKENADLIPTL